MVQRSPGLVSVVIPTYNREAFLMDSLNSIKDQTYKDIEIIVVDDASTDRTKNLVEMWKNQHPTSTVELISLPRNVGYAGALNVGYYLAKGQYIAVHDSDDLSHPKRIEKQVHYLRKNPKLGLIGTNYVSFNDKNPNKKQKPIWLKFGVERIKKMYAIKSHCVCHGTLLIRGTVFDKYGGPNRRMNGAEDYEFIKRCISEGVNSLTEVLYFVRSHPEQRSKEFYGKKK